MNEARELGESCGEYDWEQLNQSSDYCINILPRLREMAGFRDDWGFGTFTQGGEEEELNFEELFRAFEEGFDSAHAELYPGEEEF